MTDARIRLATDADAAEIRSIYAPYVSETPISFEEEPPTSAEAAARIDETLEIHPWLVCERAGTILGYAKAGQLRSYEAYRWTAELTVYVDEDVHRQGVATALYASLLACLSLQGFRSAYAAVTVPNPASVALHERFGFEAAGCFPRAGFTQGAWRDVRWFYRPIGGDSALPEENQLPADERTSNGRSVPPETKSPARASTDDEEGDAGERPDRPTPLPEAVDDPRWDAALHAGERHLER